MIRLLLSIRFKLELRDRVWPCSAIARDQRDSPLRGNFVYLHRKPICTRLWPHRQPVYLHRKPILDCTCSVSVLVSKLKNWSRRSLTLACFYFCNCHTRPQRTNSTQSISASAEELGPLVALFSNIRLAVRPAVRLSVRPSVRPPRNFRLELRAYIRLIEPYWDNKRY